MVLCEGYLGIEPHLDLWRYFFIVDLQKKKMPDQMEVPTPIGCASIHLRGSRAKEYIPVKLSSSNKGWHSQWFYLKNVVSLALLEHALPEFTRSVIETVPEQYTKWGSRGRT